MDKLLQILSVFNVATSVIAGTRDKGPQSIATAVLNALHSHVAAGSLPAAVLTGIEDVLPAVLNAHPQVANSDREHNLSDAPAPKVAAPKASKKKGTK